MGLEAGPLGVGDVALICFSHARYPTERASQNPFSDSFHAKFSIPAPIGQGRRRGDAHIVGYYAPAAGTRAEEGLGGRDAAERRAGAPNIGAVGAPTL